MSSKPHSPDLAVGSSVDSIALVIIFIVVRRVFGLGWAIAAATLWSLKAAYSRRRAGLSVGKFLPIVTLLIIGRGIIGIVTDSEAVYFGMGIATKILIGVVLIGSTVIGRNIVARYAPLVFGFDENIVDHDIYRHSMDRIAWVAGLYEILSGAFDVWLFNNASVDGYLIIRFIANWGASTVVLVGCFLYLNKMLGQISGFPGVMPLLEERAAGYDAAIRDRLGGSRGEADESD